jgi:hypothetical protein
MARGRAGPRPAPAFAATQHSPRDAATEERRHSDGLGPANRAAPTSSTGHESPWPQAIDAVYTVMESAKTATETPPTRLLPKRCHGAPRRLIGSSARAQKGGDLQVLSMRSSGLESPPPIQRTRPSTLYEKCRYVQQRPYRRYRPDSGRIGHIGRYGRCRDVATDLSPSD